MSPGSHPKISVIVPVYNAPEGLSETLKSLVDQDFSNRDYEVIVVDNRSTDSTWITASAFQKKYPDLIKIFKEESIQSSYAARNRGIRMAAADVLAFIDADMTAGPDWLRNGLKDMEKKKSDYMFFRIENFSKSDKEGLISKYTRLKEFPQEEYAEVHKFGTVGSLFIRREVFERFGYFDSRLISGGDREFGNRLYEAGIGIDFNRNIILRHPARSTFKSIVKKAFRVGRGIGQLQKLYPDRYGSMVKSPVEQGKKFFILPARLKHIFRQWEELSVWEKASFYCLALTTKTVGYAGQLWEKFR